MNFVSKNPVAISVTTGTAPLVVNSTTLVANLNADLLDGQQGSYYLSASNTNAGTLAVQYGGTGANTLTGMLKGNGTSAFTAAVAGTDYVSPSGLTSSLASYALLASPTFTGAPLAPTASQNTSTTQLATTAFVLGQASSTSPVMDGTATVGTGTTFARADHIHPSDTSKVSTSLLGANSGVATLDATGKLTTSQIPASLVGAVVYQGVWNATTNTTPTLASGTGTKGFYYKVSVAGTTAIDGISQWNIGDTIIFDGTTWDKIDGISSEVISVAGRTGAVTITATDVGLSNVTNVAQLASTQTLAITGDITASATALNTGTIATTLANTTVTAGTYNNSATAITPFTVDGKGRLTNAGTAVTITPAYTSVTGKPTTIAGLSLSDLTGVSSTATDIKMNGTQSAGALNTVARADHIHPTDTSLAPLASPALSGVPTAPTATNGTNTTQIATTAFVLANASSAISITNDTTTNATYYPLFSTTSSGTMTATKVDASGLTFNPSTGTLTTTILSSNTNAFTNTNITSGTLTTSSVTAGQVMAQYSASTYRSLECLVQVTQGTNYMTNKLLVIHDGTNAYITEYGTLVIGTAQATFDANIVGGNIQIQVTPTTASSTVFKFQTTLINI
jgi:hypothetical protein